jgi:hypothetical protein
LTTYQRWFPENFVKICLILTLKISFEKFGKNKNFRKSQKKFGQNGWRETSFFFTFSELLGPKEKREGETFPEIWKKVKITAPYCTPGRICRIGWSGPPQGKVETLQEGVRWVHLPLSWRIHCRVCVPGELLLCWVKRRNRDYHDWKKAFLELVVEQVTFIK